MKAVESQQVSFWSVHKHVAPLLATVGHWPTVGTPAWCSLSEDDPKKWAALLDAARHHALRMETAQTALAAASHDISAAANWSAVSREIQQRNDFYADRQWLRRAAS
jgi:hypothetical protein